MILITAAGLIGAFQIGVTTQAQLRAALGRPTSVAAALDEPTGERIGTMLTYGRTIYSFRRDTGRLSDFTTTSSCFLTDAGSSVGMTAAAAARLEGRRILPGCTNRLIHLRWDATHKFVLEVAHARIVRITYLGPRTLAYEPFC